MSDAYFSKVRDSAVSEVLATIKGGRNETALRKTTRDLLHKLDGN